MSTATLTGLRDYLYDTLSPANLIWLGTQLAEYGYKQKEPSLKPYTMEEINARIDQAEEELANGGGMNFDEAMDMIEKELDEELEMAEAV
jgi:hypothetical protein